MPRRTGAADDSGDFDDDALDDGPSDEDLARFSGEQAHCPACGAEIWDDAAICPQCGEVLDGDTSRSTPLDAWWRRRWKLLLVILLLASLLSLVPVLIR